MKKYRKLFIGIGCWLIFAIFLWGVWQNLGWIHRLDQFGYQLLQPTTPLRTRIFTVITHLGDPLLLLPLSLVVLVGCWWCHQRAWGLRFAGLQLVGYCLVIAVKYSILRPRPDHKLIPANGFSFPSGHTFATTVFVLAILTLVWPHLRRHWQRIASSILAMVWIFLVMASRVYLRNHYTSDVLAGLFLGTGWWLLATSTLDRFVIRHHQIGG